MLIALFVISLVLLFAGFCVTKKNATYMLNGYNTMSAEERECFDLEGFIRFSRRFHIKLAFSYLLLGVAVNTLEYEQLKVAFVAGYPVLAYMYMIKKIERLELSPNSAQENKWAFIVLSLTFVLVVLLSLFV